MNEQHPYEKHLADKLQSLNPPGDAKRHWPQMKSLLDRDMPQHPGKPGTGRWWMYGIIVAVVLTATWMGKNFADSRNNIANNHHTENHSNIEEKATQTNNDSQDNPSGRNNTTTDQSGGNEAGRAPQSQPVDGTAGAVNDQATPASNEKETAKLPAEISKQDETLNAPEKAEGTNEKPSKAGEASLIREGSNKLAGRGLNPNSAPKTTKVRSSSSSKIPNNNASASGNNRRTGESLASNQRPPAGLQKQSKRNNIDGSGKGKNEVASSATSIDDDPDFRGATRAYSTLQENYGKIDAGRLKPDTISKDYAKLVPKIERSRFKSNTDRVKSLKNRSVGTGDNKNFVFALTLPLGMPLSDQRTVAYNVNGRANTITDYIPSPNVQYHLSDKSYVQAELQVGSPQFIQPVLLMQHRYELGPASYYRFGTSSVYARKLYYFNLPLEVHYSPFKNFYLGSGIQFSSLMSGIGFAEDRAYTAPGPNGIDSVYHQRYFKFKNDSVSGRLNGNEFRVLLDANYYWKRFTVGLRYNQALSNYVAVQVSNNTPLFTDRNKSMQFYLRYNLWENFKKK